MERESKESRIQSEKIKSLSFLLLFLLFIIGQRDRENRKIDLKKTISIWNHKKWPMKVKYQ